MKMKKNYLASKVLTGLVSASLCALTGVAVAQDINPYYTDKKIAFEDFKNRSKS